MPTFPKFILHIGPHKTGTTFLQACLSQGREALRQGGISYPVQWVPPGGISHSLLHDRLSRLDPDLAAEFAAIRANDYKTIVISSEDLSDLEEDAVRYFRDLLEGTRPEVVFFCRRWSELLFSGWQETVKHGHLWTFPEFCFGHIANPMGSTIINFCIKLNRFAEIFGRSSIRLISYSRLIEENTDMFDFFCDNILGLRVDVSRPRNANRSLSPIEAETVRALNVIAAGHRGPTSKISLQRLMEMRSSPEFEEISKLMGAHVGTIRLNEGAPTLLTILQTIQERYEENIVPIPGPPNQKIFRPRIAEMPFVRTDYAFAAQVSDALATLYRAVGEA